jgi:phosphoserine phosphatase RsbU/P
LPRDVLADVAAGLYATCFIALVDLRTRTMTYSNAGHPPGVLTGPWGVHPLRAGGPPVGLLEDASYEAETLPFGEGDMITLVSDGVSETLDVAADLLPFVMAEEIIRAPSYTPKGICTHLLDATRESHGPRDVEDWADDRTVVAFGVVGPGDGAHQAPLNP